MSDPRFQGQEPFSDEEVGKLEKQLGRELPQDYREFVKQHCGAFVGGYVDGKTAWSVLDFADADTLFRGLRVHSELRKQGALPIARDELGNMWVLAKNNSIHFLVTYSGKSSAEKVSDSFQDFIDRIVVVDE